MFKQQICGRVCAGLAFAKRFFDDSVTGVAYILWSKISGKSMLILPMPDALGGVPCAELFLSLAVGGGLGFRLGSYGNGVT
jgi:hypothetical protein